MEILTNEQAADRIIEILPRMTRLISSGIQFKPSEMEITIGQFKVLTVIPRSGSLSMGAISQQLGISLPTTTEMVDRLVRERLLRRQADPHDRRVVRISLTAQGARAQTKCNVARRQRWLEMLSHLDERQCSQMVEHLGAFLKLLELACSGESAE